tara:strand:- start:3080 stop:4111 length:1032 start_codon:yes stop_codon:yes gene_type:complete
MRILKIFLYNFLILLIFLTLFEVFFGYWFKEQNFGIYIRDQRNIKKHFEVSHNGKKYKYNFIRNSLGFIGKEIDAEEIKIVFEGGSTGEQMFIPPKLRIIDILNSNFKKDNLKAKIINASKAGKTTRGYYNDFVDWFPRIKNFKPEIFIFYIGINDSILNLPKYWDNAKRDNYLENIEDFVKNNSAIYEIKIKIQNKYFSKIRSKYDLYKDDLYHDYKFVSYKQAKLQFNINELSSEEENVLNNFNKNINNLEIKIKETNIKPIFITQIKFDGVSDKKLFLINEKLKEFCDNKNYDIIKLDEIIEVFKINDFYDNVHPGINGSKKIAKEIYPYIREIIVNFYK